MQLVLPLWDNMFNLVSPELNGMTTCDECGDIIPLTNEASERVGEPPALVTPKQFGHEVHIFHFCHEDKRRKDGTLKNCACEFYLERLRRVEGQYE